MFAVSIDVTAYPVIDLLPGGSSSMFTAVPTPKIVCILAILCIACAAKEEPGLDAAPTRAAVALNGNGSDIFDLSIEELLSLKITSVSKREEKLSRADSAVYVITNEDIRRSGATHVAEALRLAPGVNVGRANANKWSVTVRGFGGVFSNKLLVLVDGRSVYNPLFSGVYWDAQDLMLEDIERIEVIRGPGAALWGANAVNGVVNVITKSSKDTQGGVVSALGGEETQAIGAVRYGSGSLSKNITYRVYAKYGDRDDSKVLNTDDDMKDEWKNARGGFRLDWVLSKEDNLTFQGDYYEGNYEQRLTTPTLTAPFTQTETSDAHFSGGNLMARWHHSAGPDSNFNLQAYYDRTVRDESFLRQEHNTGDVEFDHSLNLGTHHLVYGAGYRVIAEDLRNSFTVRFDPNHDVRHLFSAFLQDEIEVLKDKLYVTLGSKLEHNDFTGVEVQPNVRLGWLPAKEHSVWASVSRAVRTPNPTETDLRLAALATPGPGGVPNLLALVSKNDIRSEELVAFELGYRGQLHKTFSIDVAGFYNLYDNLRTTEPLAPRPQNQPSPHVLVPFQPQTKADGETFGGEISATWSPVERWRLSAHYSYLKVLLHTDPSSRATGSENGERANPQNMAHVRSFLNLPHNVELDCALYYVDHVPLANISSYVRFDARVGWRPTKTLELSICGQNLLDDQHQETGSSIFESRTEVERNIYFKLTWKF